MGTSSLNIRQVQQRLAHIRTSSARLQRLVALGRAQFLLGPDHFAIAEHHLRRSLEAVLDIGRHLIAKQGWGIPPDDRGILVTLGQNGVLTQEFIQRRQGLAGYRNRLVHGYADVSPEELYEVLSEHLPDFAEFTQCIISYVEANQKQE